MTTRNMFNVLYHRYIDQIKEQEIQKYESKHQEYLHRSGMMKKVSNYHRNHNKSSYNNNRNNYQSQSYHHQAHKASNPENYFSREQEPIPTIKKNLINTIKTTSNQNNQDHQFQSVKDPFNSQIKPSNRQQKTQFSNLPLASDRLIKKGCQNELAMPDQYAAENITLIECPEGCGRKFNQNAIEKHIKVCQKIFQGKRKPFKVKLVDQEAEKLNKKDKPAAQKPKKVAKWKKQSEQFRKSVGVVSAKNPQKNADQPQSKAELQQQDDRVLCGGCGRKFAEETAYKHIQKCIERNKRKK